MTKKILCIVLALIMMLSVLAGCGGKDNAADGGAEGGAQGDTAGAEGGVNLVYGISASWYNFAFYDSPSTHSAMINDVLFEPWAMPGETGLIYRNAESIEVLDEGMKWIVHLNPNCTWSDGEPVTAEDWVWTYETWTDPSFGIYDSSYASFLLKGCDASGVRIEGEELGMKAIDEYTLEVQWTAPQAPDTFFGWYGYYYRALPKHILGELSPAEVPTAEYWKNPIGNSWGVFVEEPTTGQVVTFAARENYYLGELPFDTLTYQVISPENAPNALLNGDIDMYYALNDFETLTGLEGQNGIHLGMGDGKFDYYTLSINHIRYNANVRYALSLLIDREVLVQAVTYGFGHGILDPVVGSGEIEARDVEKAKQILIDEGFDFENTVITIACGAPRQNVATIIQQCWAEAGVKSEIRTGETATIFAQAISGEVDCCIMGNAMSYNPTVEESILDPAATTYGQIQDSKYVDLCYAIDFEEDPAKKEQLIQEYIDVTRAECPYIYLYAYPTVVPMSARVDGVTGGTGEAPWTWTVK